jgi:hypothetical protein
VIIGVSSSSSSSSLVQQLRIAMSMSVTANQHEYPPLRLDVLFSPTNGRDQVKTSMKLGNQYGCGVQLN